MSETKIYSIPWINGRFEIRTQIGFGGLSNVFRAWDHHLKRTVAIKRVHVEMESTRHEVIEETMREAMMASSVIHPHVVSVYDYGFDSDGAYIVMELLDGENLEQCLERGPLHMDDFHRFAQQTLEGLRAIHGLGLMHRDLKPGNIMLQRPPKSLFEIKILDFGLAKSFKGPKPQSLDHFNSLMGSIHYMAPEQLQRSLMDQRADLYSLGCIYYEALTGHPTFNGSTVTELIKAHVNGTPTPLPELRPDISPVLDGWVMQLLHKDASKRHPSALDALERLPAAEQCVKAPKKRFLGANLKFP